ncbi:hypothetical protein LshimejAT787_0310470 [Lyophyllum shimeji]|uniref:Uncharacterized protein n=1 Tax=Lyophyllum shimeji TaxID=47721 RepID=A0A9P3UMH2_LYOSH|nr:hypothetical protein LshimejAT787_0310470 [Lyophyllum shimeji]
MRASTLSAALVLAASSAHALNITITQKGVPFVSSPTNPPPFAASQCDKIVEKFNTLGRSTVWNLVQKTPFQGELGEPEGMVRIGEDRYFVSAGEYTSKTVSYNGTIINGTDRTAGSGFAHLVVFDNKGGRIADATLTAPGDLEYHNGGIDYDGEYIWATLAQYRPNTTAHFVRINPRTLEPTTFLRAADHHGGVVHDTKTDRLYTLNWGARNASTWQLNSKMFTQPPTGFTKPLNVVRNPSYYADYQDCKFLGHPKAYNGRGMMICSGVTTNIFNSTIGGIALVDEETMVPVAEVPITMKSDLGTLVTMNPFDVDVVNDRLRVYFLPDQHNSTLYVYEALPNSPYEY